MILNNLFTAFVKQLKILFNLVFHVRDKALEQESAAKEDFSDNIHVVNYFHKIKDGAVIFKMGLIRKTAI